MKKGVATQNIVEYMNVRSSRTFTYLEVTIIRDSVIAERQDRKENGVVIENIYSRAGKDVVNARTAVIASKVLKTPVTAKDILLYKRCLAAEFEHRRGIPAFRFKNRVEVPYEARP